MSCREEAATSREVIALTVLSPGRNKRAYVDHMTTEGLSSHTHTHKHTLPFESDAETGCGGLWKVEDGHCIDTDEHFKGEGQLNLSQSTGDRQSQSTRRSVNTWVEPRTQRT